MQEGLDSIAQSTGQLPEKMSLDNGYQSGSNLAALEQAGVDAYVAVDRGEKSHSEPLAESTRALCKADFSYDEPADCFHCNAWCWYNGNIIRQTLPLLSVNPGREQRTITTDGHEGRRSIGTGRLKAIYKRRKDC